MKIIRAHGDFLSAWSAAVAERLANKAEEVLKGNAPFENMMPTMERCFEYIIIEEGQKLIRGMKANKPELLRIADSETINET